MATRQYIGARYVTKIYENSLDPSSAEWEAGVNYEPLTMVTYNNGSYLSKKEVAASIGDPASNPSYWTQTGFYNGQIAHLQDQIDDINSYLQSIIVTPEMFGAVGDNVADDTQAVQDALDSGAEIILFANKYKVGELTISNPVSLIGLGGNRTISGLWFSGDETEDLFTLSTNQVFFSNLSLTGNRSAEQNAWFHGAGARCIVNTSMEDVDLVIEGCTFNWFREIVYCSGRGVVIRNCNISQIVNLVDVAFVDTDDNTEWFRATVYQARRYVIENNIVHYMMYGGYLFTYDTVSEVSAGVKVPCLGLTIEGNYIDVGQRYAHIYADCYGANISNNTSVAIYTGAFQFMRCEKTIYDSIFANNVVWFDDVSDQASYACDSLLIASVGMKNVIVKGNNIHAYVSNLFIRCGSGVISRCILTENVCGNMTGDFLNSSKFEYSLIKNNLYTGTMHNATDWTNHNNICDDNILNDYS